MITIKYNDSDWQDFYSAFKTKWLPRSRAATKMILVHDIQDHFDKKVDGSGKSWSPHSSDYTKWLLRNRGKLNPLLDQKGSLRNAMRKPNVANNYEGGVRFYFIGKGRSKRYAHVHNDGGYAKYPYGNKKIGSRPIAHDQTSRKFGWVSRQATDDITKVWTTIR